MERQPCINTLLHLRGPGPEHKDPQVIGLITCSDDPAKQSVIELRSGSLLRSEGARSSAASIFVLGLLGWV